MKDQISALMDDEIDFDNAEHLLKSLGADKSLAECWAVYHAIGDTMRGAMHFSPDFQQRLMSRLDAEPTVLAPNKKKVYRPAFAVSAAASVAAVMFVGWVVLQQQAESTKIDQVVPMIAQGDGAEGSMDAYLAAHHELSPEGGMQTAYYVRPVAMAAGGN